jgi:UDP-N-acetyl-D-glucosamine dehydrogenase
MNKISETLKNKILSREAQVAVLGMGYVGLPLAVVLAESGFFVTGIDPVKEKVELLNQGKSYIPDVSTEQVARLVNIGKLKATTNYSVLAKMDAVSICVPTPLRKFGDPDLSFILSATEDLSRHMHSGMVIVLESTTYPGTTRELMLPMLTENYTLQVGKDFFLAFSPERVDPGRKDWTTVNTPKVIGGITPACSKMASLWYDQALDTVVSVSSAEVAEMAKLLENTFRMVNIGMVNEMAIMCKRLDVDVWEVVEAAATKPFGFMKFTPGPGLGGHCIPIDPLYLSWKLKSLNYNARFIELASEINSNMPRYTIERLAEALSDKQAKSLNGSKILVLGAAYKPDIDDLRESPALDLIGLLLQRKAEVSFHDPYIPAIKHDDWALESVLDLSEAIRNVDCVLVVTNHSDYDYEAILENAKLILDTRNALGKVGLGHPKVVRL